MELITTGDSISLRRTGAVARINTQGMARITITGIGKSDGSGAVAIKKAFQHGKAPEAFSPAKALSKTGVHQTINVSDIDCLVLEVTTAEEETLEVVYSLVPFDAVRGLLVAAAAGLSTPTTSHAISGSGADASINSALDDLGSLIEEIRDLLLTL